MLGMTDLIIVCSLELLVRHELSFSDYRLSGSSGNAAHVSRPELLFARAAGNQAWVFPQGSSRPGQEDGPQRPPPSLASLPLLLSFLSFWVLD